MDIKNKADYLKGQEIADDVRINIRLLAESFDRITAILADIDYIFSYDVWAAKELLNMLPKYINSNYNKLRSENSKLNSTEETRRLAETMEKEKSDLVTINKYDPDRAKELSHQFLSDIPAMERHLKKK